MSPSGKQWERNFSKEAIERMAKVRAYWDDNALKHGASYKASWEDKNVMEMEQQVVSGFIQPGFLVLDAGCANGYTSFQMLPRKPEEIRAFDYSTNMIAEARKIQPKFDPGSVIKFFESNILQISQPDNTFDLAYGIRILINLPDWELQKQAIREIHRVLKPGGLYILSEAFIGAFNRLNALRELASLPPLELPYYNLDIREEDLEEFVTQMFEIVEIKKFSSLYHVTSRFVRELAMREDEPQSYDHPINEFFKSWPSTPRSGDFGAQKAYVLRKNHSQS